MLKKGENLGHGVVMNVRKPNPLQVNKQQSSNPLRASGTESFNSKTKLRSFAGISQNPLLNKLTQKPDKKTIEFRDWKNSFYYKHLLVRHESDEDTFEKDHLLKSDEQEYLIKALKGYKSRRQSSKEQEMTSTIQAM